MISRGPTSLRLAFHYAGEIDITQADKLGPDGCLSNTAENAGLIPFGRVTSTIVDELFEPIFQQYCDTISRADFWAMIGWLSINIASAGGIALQYQYGRIDAVTCPVPSTRLPSAQLGRSSINKVFQTQMGLTLVDAVTLIGAHTIGLWYGPDSHVRRHQRGPAHQRLGHHPSDFRQRVLQESRTSGTYVHTNSMLSISFLIALTYYNNKCRDG